MTIISANWAEALDPLIADWFRQGESRRASLLSDLFDVQGSMNSDEQLGNIGAAGIDQWEVYKNEGRVPSIDFNKGYIATFTHEEFVVELPIKRSLIEDSKYAVVTDAAFQLGDSAALKREIDGASVFNNAFTDTFAGPDAVGLCSTAHPQSASDSGSTQSNEGTTSLDSDGVKSVRQSMMAYTDDQGNKMGVVPDLLLVPPALEDTALTITQSMQATGTANNDINVNNGRFRVLTWHYLTDSNAWFMIDSNLMRRSLKWFNRVPLNILFTGYQKEVEGIWNARMRYSYGWRDWRWVYGNNPS